MGPIGSPAPGYAMGPVGLPAPGFGMGPVGLPAPGYALGPMGLPAPGYAPGLPAPGYTPNLPNVGYEPPAEKPQQPTFLIHPYTRSPRDFFMWGEMQDEQLVRESRPALVP